MGFNHFTNGFLADEIPLITKGESVLYKYAAGSDAMLLEYCDMLNIENQHLFDSNKELSCWVLHLETTLETLESRILHIDCQMEHCLSLHAHGDGSAENLFTLEGGDLRISITYDLTNPYFIELVCVGGGVVHGQHVTHGHKRADWVPTVRKLDLSQLCFSLNFYFLMFLRLFPFMFPLLTYSQSFFS